MSVSNNRKRTPWLLLTFTLPARRASQRVKVWRKLQRYGTVPLGNSGYLLPSDSMNEERLQWLATAIRKYGGDASIVQVQSIDNISTPQLIGRFVEARGREYQELIRELQGFLRCPHRSEPLFSSGCGAVSRRLLRSTSSTAPCRSVLVSSWREPMKSVCGRGCLRLRESSRKTTRAGYG